MDTFRTGVVLDLDGTLVDSVYHHVLAWDEALRAEGLEAGLWRIHRAIGMGGDRLLPWVLGRPPGDVDGEALAKGHERAFLARAEDLRPTPGARELLADLEDRGVPFTVATSSGETVVAALLAVLGRDDFDLTSGDEVASTKPAPDSVLAACAELGVEPGAATMVGDSPWDAEAAGRVGVRAIGVRCGGFGEAELTAAGAALVVDTPRDLLGRL
jgi:HAD superfamily hydrolase (TIGR01509 family)